ncbi:MAG: HlyD family efflux transporter periplasmic adaptor subunit [Candidatus Krumholzibacteriota bacterium]
MSPKTLQTVIICLLLTPGCKEPDSIRHPDATTPVTHLNEAGTIAAANTVTMNGPGWGGGQRINWLIPEGTRVVHGDTLIRFDTSDFDKYIQQNSDELDVMRLAVASSRAQGAANQTRTRNSIDKAQLASEMAQLDLKNKQYESRTVLAKAELAGKQAEIDLLQARRGSLAQATLDSLEIAQATLKATKQEARVRRLQTYLDQLFVTSPTAGMVVYHREYTEEGVKVYRAGDEVSRQAPVLEISDTSGMKVTFTVHEKDRWRMRRGQKVQIILDAYTDATFTGVVDNVGRLPLAAVEGSVARRFEATATIDDDDPRLKSGMSARVIIELGGSP